MYRTLRSAFCALILFGVSLRPAGADVSLPSIIGRDMVLQRGTACPIWGWAAPGEQVSVEFAGQKASVTAGADGRWQVRLRAMSANGTPQTMTIRGSNTLTLEGVLVGEVWLCSGQSNMEWSVAQSLNPQEEIAAGDHPRIRHIKIPHRPSDKPEQNVPSDGWKIASPQTVGSFTAAGYFFARHLQKELDVPIGLIGSNWGGTRIEPWTPPVGFQKVPALKDIADKLASFPAKIERPDPNDSTKKITAINHQSPLALYNGMIHPLLPFAIQGAIWYQGESNNGEGMLYFEKMKALIEGWRSLWNRPDMPFYFVQLAPFRYGGDPTRLAGIWEAQQASLAIPHTGMAATVDIGNVADIHPKNKQEVGRRLALWALAKTYGRPIRVYSGPLFKSAAVEGNKIRIRFDHAGSGLMSRDSKPLSHFTIAGEDGNFVPAEAVVDGDTVLVSSPQVAKPVHVRFAWHQEAEPNLSSREGLPASPFRTDRP